MCCVLQQRPNHKKTSFLNEISPILIDIQSNFCIFAQKSKSIISFKNCVKINVSIMDKSQHGNNVPDYSNLKALSKLVHVKSDFHTEVAF